MCDSIYQHHQRYVGTNNSEELHITFYRLFRYCRYSEVMLCIPAIGSKAYYFSHGLKTHEWQTHERLEQLAVGQTVWC